MVPLWNNCENRLCDIDPKNRNLCPKDVEKLIDKNTKAIIAVNYAGSDTKPLRKFYGLIIGITCCFTQGWKKWRCCDLVFSSSKNNFLW